MAAAAATRPDRSTLDIDTGPPVPRAVYLAAFSAIGMAVVSLVEVGARGDWADVFLLGGLTTLIGWGVVRGNYVSLILAGLASTVALIGSLGALWTASPAVPSHGPAAVAVATLAVTGWAALVVVAYSDYFTWHNQNRHRSPDDVAVILGLACLAGVLWGVVG